MLIPAPTTQSFQCYARRMESSQMSGLRAGCRQHNASEEVVKALGEERVDWSLEDDESFCIDDLLDLEGFCEVGNVVADDIMDTPAAALYGKLGEPAMVSQLATPWQLMAAELDIPIHDSETDLLWLSSILDDSLSEMPPMVAPQPRTWLPHERQHDGACGSLSRETAVPVKAKRSHRSRATGWAQRARVSAVARKTARKHRRQPPRRPTVPAVPTDRRCSHCGVQSTPQWREGPEGAKTLCNACGVRFKSGRLLPEYRPASSPTFVGAIHSNSHRKVLELRRKKEERSSEATSYTATTSWYRF